MSHLINDMIIENIYEDIEDELNAGKLSKEINEIAYFKNLHADDDLDVILEIILEDRYESRSI
tara:strand:+ start:463 stop:651 length:189 start_codon:yes stop_codon:yes gene_type:complete